MSTWDDLSERDKAISLYSDLYKDLNGFRPRGRWMLTCPLADEALEANVAMGGNGWEYTPAGA
jgi:hypothetical protein